MKEQLKREHDSLSTKDKDYYNKLRSLAKTKEKVLKELLEKSISEQYNPYINYVIAGLTGVDKHGNKLSTDDLKAYTDFIIELLTSTNSCSDGCEGVLVIDYNRSGPVCRGVDLVFKKVQDIMYDGNLPSENIGVKDIDEFISFIKNNTSLIVALMARQSQKLEDRES